MGGAQSSGCMQNLEQQGEGFSDWFGLMLTMREGDSPSLARGVATYSSGQDSAPDNTEFSVALGETGLGVTYGDYDEYGEYTIISYDLPVSVAGLGVSLSWSDFSAETSSGLADEDTFVITFSM